MLGSGSVIADKYRVVRLLGEGGMGSVYIAENLVLRKQVALKVMSASFASDASATERFFREAMSASRVRHPAIVEIFDAGHTRDGQPWMAMELLDGESLGQRLTRVGVLPLGEVVPIFGPVLAALDAVHSHGIVHRDLKPDNIFIERLPDHSVQPKLLDFGIAKHHDGLDRLTRTGAVMGTACYLAPEQARDSSGVDPRTDLYAVGVVLYECLSGRLPHEATTLPELISKLITEPPRPLLEIAPHVPAELANVVHWCLATDVGARPQRASDLGHHLARALSSVPSHVTPPPVEPGPVDARAATGAVEPGGVGAFFAAGLSPQSPSPGPPTRGSPFQTPAPQGSPPQGLPPQGLPPQGLPPLGPPPPPGAPGFGWQVSPTAPLGMSSGPPGWAAAPAAIGSASRGSGRGWVWAIVAVALLGGCLVFAVPVVLTIVGAAASFGAASGAGSGGWNTRFPVSWLAWRMPTLVDVDGDGDEDVVGWTWRVVSSDTHEFLCAFDGTDGHELWCADVGEQDDSSEAETVYASDRVIFFSPRGRLSAYRLRDGESLGWTSSVRGEPEEICALGTDRLMVRTPDRLWSEVTIASGRVALVGEAAPQGCRPAAIASPPARLGLRITSATWTSMGRGAGPITPPGMGVDEGFASPDGARQLLVGRRRGEARNPGLLALIENGMLRWQTVVPNDPLRAQAQPPEAVAITDDAIFAAYEMTGRGEAPRRVAAFRASDGERMWDVGLPEARGNRAWYLVGGRQVVVLCVNQILLVLDRTTGETRYQIGEPPRR